jgi:tetratricopeptide (TPR) repeat protein
VGTLIQEADRARRENRLPDARRDFAEAVALGREAGSPGDLVRALRGLAQVERDLGRGDAVLPLYEEAVAVCRRQGDPLDLAHTIRHLGDVHRAAGRSDLAEPCYVEALALYRGSERTDPLDLANAVRPLAILEESRGEVEAARALWTEARRLYEVVNVRQGVAECADRLARLGT